MAKLKATSIPPGYRNADTEADIRALEEIDTFRSRVRRLNKIIWLAILIPLFLRVSYPTLNETFLIKWYYFALDKLIFWAGVCLRELIELCLSLFKTLGLALWEKLSTALANLG